MAFAGTAFVLLSTVAWLLAGEDNAFVGTLFGLGLFAGWPVGFPLLGVATLRAKVLPRWSGVVLVAFFPVLFAILSVYVDGGRVERARVAGAGLRSLDARGHGGRATFARALSFRVFGYAGS